MRPSATISGLRPRTGSILIMVAALLLVMVVLAFGFVDYITTQRGVARRMNEEALLRTALISGRELALAALQSQSATAPTTLNQPWVAWFGPTAAWPDASTTPDPTLRRTARQALVTGTWADSNCYDLFRHEAGLASPVVLPTGYPHGHDDGYTVHDGTGRWWIAGAYDRQFVPVATGQASYVLRYAIGIIDQSGLLLANKARYRHVTGGSRLPINSWYQDAVTNPVPVDGVPCPVTDKPLGVNDNALGYDRSWYNTWRAIPADHRHLAYFLAVHGFGLDESRPKTLTDDFAFVGNAATRSVGRHRDSKGNEINNPMVERKPGTLTDQYRKQGYSSVTLEYPQFSQRFSDFLPFETEVMAPDDATVTFPDVTNNRFRGWVQYPTASYQDHDDPWVQNAWPWDPGHTIEQSLERVRNRHPANLAALASATRFHNPAIVSASMAVRLDGEIEYMLWSQLDFPGWQAIAQGFRMHPVITDANGTVNVRTPSAADGIVQCFTPFGSPFGMWNYTAAVASGTTSAIAKNRFEMRTNWSVNINTAPPRVLEGLIRTVLPETDSGVSPESTDPSDYNAKVAQLVDGIRSGVPFTQAAVTPGMAWANLVADSRLRRSLNSLIGGGSDGNGPVSEFAVKSIGVADPGNANPLLRFDHVVISGRHRNRFYVQVPTSISEHDFRVWLAKGYSGGSTGDIRSLPPASGGAASSRSDRPFAVSWSGTAANMDVRYVNCTAPGVVVEAAAGTDTWIRLNLARGAGFGGASEFTGPFSGEAPANLTAFIDYTSERRRDAPGVLTTPLESGAGAWVWQRHGPGLGLVAAPSRHYRVVVRAELVDLDNPSNTRSTSWDNVFMLDADRSGPDVGNGYWDTVMLYQDLENPFQYAGQGPSITW